MSSYIPIICFLLGVVVGAGLMLLGFHLGFKASYEIRESKDMGTGEIEGKGLFKKNKEPAEFELLDEMEKN